MSSDVLKITVFCKWWTLSFINDKLAMCAKDCWILPQVLQGLVVSF